VVVVDEEEKRKMLPDASVCLTKWPSHLTSASRTWLHALAASRRSFLVSFNLIVW
jgi:hypothetical protein